MKSIYILPFILFALAACDGVNRGSTESAKTAQVVERQQSQYAIAQPIPAFDFSLERDLVIQLYNLRNQRALTHSVWRSDLGMIEGDCASIGFGIPYDTSLTNPLVATNTAQDGKSHTFDGGALTSIEQPEPNGVFASKNTSATWVMCAGETGLIEPVYIETKVTVYPYSVSVDYDSDRVIKTGEANATLTN